MRFLLKIFPLIIILSLNADAQTVTWQKWFDYNNVENAGEDIIQTLDGGYAMLNHNYGNTDVSSVLFKLNSLGEIEWQTGLTLKYANAISQAGDSSFIIAGEGLNSTGVLTKISKTGETQWSKTYYNSGVYTSSFDDLIITKEEEIVACGLYMIKTDSEGKILWDTIYGCHRIAGSNNGNYYITSSVGLRKIDSEANTIWFTSFPYYMKSLVVDSTGNIYTSGGTNSIYVFKFDSSGTLLWNKFYSARSAFSMCLSKDNKLLISGIYDTLIQTGIEALKLNLNGDVIFKRKIRSVTDDWFVIPYAVNSTYDNGFIFTGQTDYPGFPFDDNAIVVKTDSECYAPMIVGIINLNSIIAEDFVLEQNFPNPFNSQTNIVIQISKSGKYTLEIFNTLGNLVDRVSYDNLNSGKYSIRYDASALSSGVYYYSIKSEGVNSVKKFILLK